MLAHRLQVLTKALGDMLADCLAWVDWCVGLVYDRLRSVEYVDRMVLSLVLLALLCMGDNEGQGWV
jgi:hypothetical protein